MRHSLRFKVFRMNLIPVAAAVIVFMMLVIFQVRYFGGIMEKANTAQNEVIIDTMSETLWEMTMENFQKHVIAEANILNGEFKTTRHDLEVLASQVKMALESSSWGAGTKVSLPSMEDKGKLTLQLMYSDEASLENKVLRRKIRQVGSLGAMMLKMVDGTDALMDCVIALEDGASIIADRTPESKFEADGTLMTYNAKTRPWYAGACVHGDTYFSPINEDSFTGELQVMAGVPVFINQELAAVCGGSVHLKNIGDIVLNAQLGEYTQSCLINGSGNVVYSSLDTGELGLEDNKLKSLKESSNAELVALVDEAISGDLGFSMIMVDGKPTLVAFAPVETVGWTLLLMISQEDLYRTTDYLLDQTDSVMAQSLEQVKKNERNTIFTTLVIAAVLLLLAVFISLFFSEGLVRPIRRMTIRIASMRGEDMVFRTEDSMRTGDEIELLADAFEKMSLKMKGYVGEIVKITSEKQRLDTELAVGADIQKNMLPNHFPAFPGRKEFDLYAVMDPAREVGGDFYDFFLIDQDHLAVVMADVSGKGVPAALFMVVSKTLIKNATLSGMYSGPAQILSGVNDLLCEGNDDDMFVTVWLGILTVSTGSLVSACAGHEYPVFYRKESGFVMEKDPHGMPMGGMTGLRYEEANWKLNPGDMLFLYTDGVPEANNSKEELFGNERMLAALSYSMSRNEETGKVRLQPFLKTVRSQIDEFAGDTPQFDDLTMLCLQYEGPEH